MFLFCQELLLTKVLIPMIRGSPGRGQRGFSCLPGPPTWQIKNGELKGGINSRRDVFVLSGATLDKGAYPPDKGDIGGSRACQIHLTGRFYSELSSWINHSDIFRHKQIVNLP
jgi:hypothetical protein